MRQIAKYSSKLMKLEANIKTSKVQMKSAIVDKVGFGGTEPGVSSLLLFWFYCFEMAKSCVFQLNCWTKLKILAVDIEPWRLQKPEDQIYACSATEIDSIAPSMNLAWCGLEMDWGGNN